MSIKRPHATSYELAIAMFVLICHRLQDIVEMCSDVDLDVYNGQMLNVNMQIKMPYETLLEIAMFILNLTVCEIITYELPNVGLLN